MEIQQQQGSYTVLARRYRSRSFDELVGQEPIARTLQNAVETGRSAHAYLFCGSRGVGKTSMARILACALNVTDDLEQKQEITDAIFRGDDLDVIEIDGASNRGINEVRDLIAAAGLSPARCPYKIYIIDEVHQITRDAFNALLKIMEEPPAHVKFILCTTEAHKVPATIQSRCQRFDFRLLSTAQIAAQLHHILDAEGINADEEVVAAVARLGRGSMRDALSLLDRLLATGADNLSIELLEQMLGLPEHALVSSVVDAVAAGDAAAGLQAAALLLEKGASEDQALELLLDHLRSLLLVVTCGVDSELVELSTEGRAAAAEQAKHFDAPGLVHMIALCDAVARNARGSTAARALYDATIVRMCHAERFADAVALLQGAEPAKAPPKKKPVNTSPPAETPTKTLVEPKATPEPEPELEPAPPSATDDGADMWRRVCSIASDSPNEHAIVENLEYRSLNGTLLTLAVVTDDDNLARWLNAQSDAISALVKRATEQRVTVRLESAPTSTPAETRKAERAKLTEAEANPLVRTAMEIFDADVVDVQDTGEKPRPDPERKSPDV